MQDKTLIITIVQWCKKQTIKSYHENLRLFFHNLLIQCTKNYLGKFPTVNTGY